MNKTPALGLHPHVCSGLQVLQHSGSSALARWHKQGDDKQARGGEGNDAAEYEPGSLLHSGRVFENLILSIALIFTLTLFTASSVLIIVTPVSIPLQATVPLQN